LVFFGTGYANNYTGGKIVAHSLFEIDELISVIRQQRDELNVQMHLAKAEILDEWKSTEIKFEQLVGKANSVKKEAGEASKDILSALELVADEVKHGYERIRKKI
jgi:hypothetical protein